MAAASTIAITTISTCLPWTRFMLFFCLMLVHVSHVLCEIAGRTYTQKYTESGRSASINRFQLRRETVCVELPAEAHTDRRNLQRKVAFITECIGLHPANGIFFHGKRGFSFPH